jgi:transcription antitermination factor NusG
MSNYQENQLASSEETSFGEGRLGWYAIQTRARHEKRIGAELHLRGIHAFVPTVDQAHRWSDRTKIVEVPLFSCYVFVRLAASSKQRLEVLKTPGVFRFVSVNGAPAQIPDCQIGSIQTVLSSRLPFSTSGFVQIGQRVRIRGGALDGVEGVLKEHKGGQKLVISVDLIQQSIELTVEGYSIELVQPKRSMPIEVLA